MKDIQSIYILDVSGKPIFIYEKYTKNMNEAHHALFSNFITGIQKFVTELGVEETKSIELGKSKIFSNWDKVSKLRFVIKASKDAEEKKINKILNRIKNSFIDKINQNIELNDDNKAKIITSFNEELKVIIESETNIQSFLKSM